MICRLGHARPPDCPILSESCFKEEGGPGEIYRIVTKV
jgi:hypothetical protein